VNKNILLIPACFLVVSCAGSGLIDHENGFGGLHHNSDSTGRYSFPSQRAATGKKVFVFDPRATAWAAYNEEGKRIKTGRASGGKDFCEDVGRPCRTVTGKYRVYSKKGANCKSSKYPIEEGGGALMPYCMHFHGGYSIHGAYEVPNYNASHGCIRVLPSAAKWLNQNFLNNGSTVIVKPYG
jgi:lipoprotein-anchoring transpeptidase ErfK/SrfK